MRYILIAGLALTMAAAWGAKKKELVKPSPLTGKLVLNKDTYDLPADQRGEEFRKKLKETEGEKPEPPAVDIVLELTNTTDRPVVLMEGSDNGRLDLELTGPGAIAVPGQQMMTMEFRLGKPVKIAPGGKHEISIKALKWGMRNVEHYGYWTEPGEYTLKATLKWTSNAEGGGPVYQLQTEAVKVTVKG